MLALVGTVMSRSPSRNVLLRDGDGVLGTHTLDTSVFRHGCSRCAAILVTPSTAYDPDVARFPGHPYPQRASARSAHARRTTDTGPSPHGKPTEMSPRHIRGTTEYRGPPTRQPRAQHLYSSRRPRSLPEQSALFLASDRWTTRRPHRRSARRHRTSTWLSSQYTALAFTEELVAAGIAGSIGTVGDALDNALMESMIGLYKAECVTVTREGQNWNGLRDVERETAEWVRWYNDHRIHSSIDYLTSIERELMYVATIAQRGDVASTPASREPMTVQGIGKVAASGR
jgi:hypothetical protein